MYVFSRMKARAAATPNAMVPPNTTPNAEHGERPWRRSHEAACSREGRSNRGCDWLLPRKSRAAGLKYCPVTPEHFRRRASRSRFNSTQPTAVARRVQSVSAARFTLMGHPSRGTYRQKLRLRWVPPARLTVGGGVGAALMRVVDDVAQTERLLKRGATGVTNAVADVKRARNASAEKRAIFTCLRGGLELLLCVASQKCGLLYRPSQQGVETEPLPY